MDFVNHLRLLQADEPSSDEESTPKISPASSPDCHDRSSVSDSTTLTIPDKSGEEKKFSIKRKREAAAESVSSTAKSAEDADKCLRPEKKVKTESPSAVDELPRAGTQKSPSKVNEKPAPQTNGKAPSAAAENGEKKMKKRKLGDGKDQNVHEQQPALKKAKPGNNKPGKQASIKAESKKGSPSAPALQKPVHKLEYFELRAHQMLSNPLGFDDLVYDTTKQQPAYVKRSFAKCRRRQRDPTPPLEMSGGLGPAANTKQANNKRQQSENLAKNAQKRAHQQRVKEQVEDLLGESVSAAKKRDERNGLINGQQAHKSKTTLSPYSQYQGSAKKKTGGLQQPTSSKKYTKSTYFEAPTMDGAISDTPGMSGAIATSDAPTMIGAIANDIPAGSSAISPKSKSTSGKDKPIKAEKKLPSPDRAWFKQQAESGPARTCNLEMFSSLPDPEQPPSDASVAGPVTPRRQAGADSHAFTAQHQTPSPDSPPLSPCYLPDADDIPFVLGHVSGEVFDADPPSPGGTLSKRNSIFAPRKPPRIWSMRKQPGSPSPARGDRGKGLLGRFAESCGGCSGNGDEQEGDDDGYDEDETEVEGWDCSDDERYETEGAGCDDEEETEGEGENGNEVDDEHGDDTDTEAETEREATDAADTEAETEPDDNAVDTLPAPPPSPTDDLIRIIDPLGGLIPCLTTTAAAKENRNKTTAIAAAAAAAPRVRPARTNAAWPPVTPAPKPRRADNTG
ncbi:hypothetical protein MFIFM68171_00362 [Madurella fahalii]|uniref:Uncharacterized protein n=1 Tax=Madurella fahalii TaxID=1157608 RepID=A0ABQ0FXB9_9PEZI